ncbi:hypothetical protein Sme01_42220 [Sphaerisporangium melleum]|uniref:IclR family transcriptional regulator n=1 Tax=Sphaerisporangium melleum TaxID=321316 RepID=A0A917RKX1_9ACTN|nr:IclR family transcriptional regulator [Sphaerisporangium melleum]GGL11291.1 hypothetical protein GCM10007964_61810 [Sphaerisporangium melleum]GII71746.1 hypothetical protein Sme01_42220 [Sphaerisporangium melleum]
MAGGSSEPGRSVTSRVLAILAAFDADHAELTLTDIARRGGLALPTAHRLVRELEAARMLVRDAQGRFHVGHRLWELGQLAPRRLLEVAHPWMQELYAGTGENVHLAVRDGMEVLYVHKVYGRHAVPIVSRVGGRLPMHPTGVGKVLLAYEAGWFVTSYLSRELERPTPHTITEPGRLARELAAVRAQGHAYTYEEMTLGSCSAAAPIIPASSAAFGNAAGSMRSTSAAGSTYAAASGQAAGSGNGAGHLGEAAATGTSREHPAEAGGDIGDRPIAALGIVLSSHRARELPRLVEPLLAAAREIARAYGAATAAPPVTPAR